MFFTQDVYVFLRGKENCFVCFAWFCLSRSKGKLTYYNRGAAVLFLLKLRKELTHSAFSLQLHNKQCSVVCDFVGVFSSSS